MPEWWDSLPDAPNQPAAVEKGGNWWDSLPDAPAQAAPTEQQAEPEPKPSLTSLVKNFGAGANAQIASVGGLLDLPARATNLGIRGINKVAGTELPELGMPSQLPMRGMEALGINTPLSVQPQNRAERIASGVGGGVAAAPVMALTGGATAAALPNTLAGRVGATLSQSAPTLGAAASQAAASGVGGATGQIAREAVPEGAPEWVRDVADLGGNIVGGAGAAAAGHYTGKVIGSAAQHVKDYTAPLGEQGRQRLATQEFRGGLENPEAARYALNDMGEPTVPGERPTTLQVTGQGGEVDRAMRQKFGGDFAARDAQNNAARVDAVKGLAPEGAESASVGDFLRQQLAGLDQMHTGAENTARARVQTATEDLGGQMAPEQYGAQGRELVSRNYAPAFEAQQRAIEQARAAAQSETASLGGEGRPETYGAALRGQPRTAEEPGTGLAGQASEAKARTRALWAAFNPDGKASMDVRGLRSAPDEILSRFSATADEVAGAEASILKKIQGLPDVAPINRIQAIRAEIGDAVRKEIRAGGSAESPIVARLQAYKTALDHNVASAVERQHDMDVQAVAAGRMAPEDSIGGRLAALRDQWYAQGQNAAETGSGRASSGPPGGNAGGRPQAVPGVGGAAGQERGGPGNAPGAQGVQGQDLRPLTAEDQAAYKAARRGTAEYKQTFRQGQVGKVLAQSPEGFRTPDSGVGPSIWRAGPKGAESVGEYVRKGGDVGALRDYVASSLREARVIRPDNTLDRAAFDRWSAKHEGALQAAPDIDAALRNAAQRNHTLDDALHQMEALERSHPLASTSSDSQVMGKYWRAGPVGAESVRNFLRDTGGSPEALATLKDYAVSSLRDRGIITPEGTVDTRKFAAWQRQHRGALDAAPEIRESLSTVERAQNALNEAGAARTQALDDFQKGAAGKLIGSDTVEKSNAAVSEALKNPAQMRDLQAKVRGNADAEAGLKKLVTDHILSKVQSTVESGSTGVDKLKSDAFQKYVKANRESLKVVFGGQGYQNLEAVAASLKRAGRTGNATQALPGSATGQNTGAREAHTVGGHGGNSGVQSLVVMEMLEKVQHAMARHPIAAAAGGAAAHGAAGGVLGGPAGAILGAAAGGGVILGNALRQAGLESVDKLVARMALDPEFARTMMSTFPQNQLGQRRLAAKILSLAPSAVSQEAQKVKAPNVDLSDLNPIGSAAAAEPVRPKGKVIIKGRDAPSEVDAAWGRGKPAEDSGWLQNLNIAKRGAGARDAKGS